MAKAPALIKYPNPSLFQRAWRQADIRLASAMQAAMIKGKGVGLAAPQIGLENRMFVTVPEFGVSSVVMEPVIVDSAVETVAAVEGCLSLPGVQVVVSRPVWVEVEYLNEDGDFIQKRLHGFAARLFQHEFDHLEGKLIATPEVTVL